MVLKKNRPIIETSTISYQREWSGSRDYQCEMQNEGADSSLDFTSSEFDPLKALHTDSSKLQLPYPNVQPCDNLDAYESSKAIGYDLI